MREVVGISRDVSTRHKNPFVQSECKQILRKFKNTDGMFLFVELAKRIGFEGSYGMLYYMPLEFIVTGMVNGNQ